MKPLLLRWLSGEGLKCPLRRGTNPGPTAFEKLASTDISWWVLMPKRLESCFCSLPWTWNPKPETGPCVPACSFSYSYNMCSVAAAAKSLQSCPTLCDPIWHRSDHLWLCKTNIHINICLYMHIQEIIWTWFSHKQLTAEQLRNMTLIYTNTTGRNIINAT